MAKQTPVLIKTFTVDATVNGANRCLVMSGTNAGNAKLPGGALATKFVGVSEEDITSNSNSFDIAVRVSGIAQVISDGSAVITAGDYLQIASSLGDVKTVAQAFGSQVRQIVGLALSSAPATAGALVDMLIQPAPYIGA